MDNTARELRNAYQRAWNAKNPDKLKKYRQAYWERKAQAAKAGEKTASKE